MLRHLGPQRSGSLHTAQMPEEVAEGLPSKLAWKRLERDRPWYRRLASQALTEALVAAPDGTRYIVRVRRNAPLAGPDSGADHSELISVILGLVKSNARVRGETGWTIDVVAPEGRWKGERVLYSQRVGARAILADVVLAVTNAVQRGDKFWQDDQAY
jgi:hypothetical protein